MSNTLKERMQSEKNVREKSEVDDRLKELKDQNEYLKQKLDFLKLHESRNAKECERLVKSNAELKKVRDDMKAQMKNILNTLDEWNIFQSEVLSIESNVRSKTSWLYQSE